MKTPLPAVINRPYGLCKFDLDHIGAKALDNQLWKVVEFHTQHISAVVPLRQQMQALARSAYLQGVMDGSDYLKGKK